MTETIPQYAVGDWVVHHAYGIGEIKKIEEKPINGEMAPCFQVKAKNGAQWWFLSNGTANPRIRPVASPEMITQIQEEFQEPVQDLNQDKGFWKSRINEVTASGDFLATAQILRDLTVLRTHRKLNQMEVKAMNLFKDRLLSEWAATMQADIEILRQKLKDYLKACTEEAAAENNATP